MKKKYRVVLVGGECVGKTSIVNKFIFNKFIKGTKPTAGQQTYETSLPYYEKQFNLKIYDTPGQKSNRPLVCGLFSKADAIVTVFDMSRINTLIQLEEFWLKKIESKTKKNQPLIIIMGAKRDKLHSEEEFEQIQQKIDQIRQLYECIFICGSALEEQSKEIPRIFEKTVDYFYNSVKRESMVIKYQKLESMRQQDLFVEADSISRIEGQIDMKKETETSSMKSQREII